MGLFCEKKLATDSTNFLTTFATEDTESSIFMLKSRFMLDGYYTRKYVRCKVKKIKN